MSDLEVSDPGHESQQGDADYWEDYWSREHTEPGRKSAVRPICVVCNRPVGQHADYCLSTGNTSPVLRRPRGGRRMRERLDIRIAARLLRAMRFLGRWARDIGLFVFLLAVLLVCWIFDVDWL